MKASYLEHTNITVTNPDELASLLCHLFDWKIRWSGGAKNNGYTVHVGDDNAYLALYRPATLESKKSNYQTLANVNHIGIVVDNLEAIEAKVRTMNFTTYSHGDYEPGRRFYFTPQENIEIEVVSYTPQLTYHRYIIDAFSKLAVIR